MSARTPDLHEPTDDCPTPSEANSLPSCHPFGCFGCVGPAGMRHGMCFCIGACKHTHRHMHTQHACSQTKLRAHPAVQACCLCAPKARAGWLRGGGPQRPRRLPVRCGAPGVCLSCQGAQHLTQVRDLLPSFLVPCAGAAPSFLALCPLLPWAVRRPHARRENCQWGSARCAEQLFRLGLCV